jgi:hypothetical protein
MEENQYTLKFNLISHVTGSWDEQLLGELFYNVDVGRVLQCLLNNQGFDVFISW